MMPENILLADCVVQEVQPLVDGLQTSHVSISVHSHIANWKRTGKVSEAKRYLKYFSVGFSYFLNRKKYGMVIGWQQFYALIHSFFCSVFRVKKVNTVIALNFTYKEKSGKLAGVYRWFMGRCLDPQYMDYIHVLSDAYADEISREFQYPRERILVTGFGVNDPLPEYADMQLPLDYQKDGYALAIGRSNRDYDFLIQAWESIEYPLVIISDTYNGETTNNNIRIYRNIGGEESYPWIANCGLMILPIDDGNICSGDTVLLNAMGCQRKILVTTPSTLAEMYVEDGKTALLTPKEPVIFCKKVQQALNDPQYANMGQHAREAFLEKYSRKTMGQNLSCIIFRNKEEKHA